MPDFPAPPSVSRQRCVKAVGNRNTMAATLSLTQVTLSYNSNLTAVNESGPLPVPSGNACVVLAWFGGLKGDRSPAFASLFLEVESCCDWEKVSPTSSGTA